MWPLEFLLPSKTAICSEQQKLGQFQCWNPEVFYEQVVESLIGNQSGYRTNYVTYRHNKQLEITKNIWNPYSKKLRNEIA